MKLLESSIAVLLLLSSPSFAYIEEEITNTTTWEETRQTTQVVDGEDVVTVTITEGSIEYTTTESPIEEEYFYTNDVFEQNETYHTIISTEASLDEYYVVEVYGEEPDIYMEENDIITEDHDGLSEYQGRTIYIEEDDVTHEQIKADDALGQWEKRRQKWT